MTASLLVACAGQGYRSGARSSNRFAHRAPATIGCRTPREEDRMRRLGLIALAALLMAGSAKAQDTYPTQTVKFVLPSAPGSTTDILTRLTADQLGRKWGKPTVVENIAGGTMNIGAGVVSRLPPDGYTLFVAPP